MADGHGIATLDFPAAAQPAEVTSRVVVTDSVPYPNDWSYGAMPAGTNSWFATEYGGGVFVSVRSGTTNAASSTDGLNWTPRTLPGTLNWGALAYGAGVFVAIGFSNTSACVSSPTGTTWAFRNFFSGGNWKDLIFADGWFVACSGTGNINRSEDGIAWYEPLNDVGYVWGALAYGNGEYMVIESGGFNRVKTSPDSMSWNPVASLPGGGAFIYSYLAYGNGIFMAMANNLPVIAVSSDNGGTWTSIDLPMPGGTWTDLKFINGAFVAVMAAGAGAGSQICTTPDGITWTQHGLSQGVDWRAVTFGGDRFVAVGNHAFSAASPDGVHGLTPNVRTLTTVDTETVPAKPVVGSNVASVTITGQTGLLATDHIDAWIQGSDSTTDHNAYEHKLAPIKLAVMNAVAGDGFDIVGFSEHRLDGDFKVRWAWAT